MKFATTTCDICHHHTLLCCCTTQLEVTFQICCIFGEKYKENALIFLHAFNITHIFTTFENPLKFDKVMADNTRNGYETQWSGLSFDEYR